jgi:hypothetical protein
MIMPIQHLCSLFLLASMWASCGEKKAASPTPENPSVAVPQKFKLDTASSADVVAPQAGVLKGKDPKKNIYPENPTPSRPPGSPAYITKSTAMMFEGPSEKASKIPRKFDVSESIYILETKMSDESGKQYDVPQWYKIQCSEGRKGWIMSRFVGLPF